MTVFDHVDLFHHQNCYAKWPFRPLANCQIAWDLPQWVNLGVNLMQTPSHRGTWGWSIDFYFWFLLATLRLKTFWIHLDAVVGLFSRQESRAFGSLVMLLKSRTRPLHLVLGGGLQVLTRIDSAVLQKTQRPPLRQDQMCKMTYESTVLDERFPSDPYTTGIKIW